VGGGGKTLGKRRGKVRGLTPCGIIALAKKTWGKRGAEKPLTARAARPNARGGEVCHTGKSITGKAVRHPEDTNQGEKSWEKCPASSKPDTNGGGNRVKAVSKSEQREEKGQG